MEDRGTPRAGSHHFRRIQALTPSNPRLTLGGFPSLASHTLRAFIPVSPLSRHVPVKVNRVQWLILKANTASPGLRRRLPPSACYALLRLLRHRPAARANMLLTLSAFAYLPALRLARLQFIPTRSAPGRLRGLDTATLTFILLMLGLHLNMPCASVEA